MKPFTKLLLLTSFLLGLSTTAFAAEKYDTKAFRTATKLCYSCHGTPFYLAKQLDDDDWDFYFNTKGKLEKIHKGKPEAISALRSPLFKKRKERLLKFFIANSMYAGAVNGCDANFCGTLH